MTIASSVITHNVCWDEGMTVKRVGQVLSCGVRMAVSCNAGNASQVAQLLLASAEATVALGQPSVYGADNIANKTNDIKGASTLAAALRQSNLTQPVLDNALSAAIAKGLNESSEAAAVLVANAMMIDNSIAVAVTAEGIT